MADETRSAPCQGEVSLRAAVCSIWRVAWLNAAGGESVPSPVCVVGFTCCQRMAAVRKEDQSKKGDVDEGERETFLRPWFTYLEKSELKKQGIKKAGGKKTTRDFHR